MNIEELYTYIDTPEKTFKTRIALINSFEMYFKFMFLAINTTNAFFLPFHKEITQKLEKIVFQENKKRNLVINIPVGSGKSILVQYFISWCFARDINNAFVYTSFSDLLINKLSKETKEIVEHPMWTQLFDSTLKKDEKAKVNWGFNDSVNRTGLTAGTIGGSITGLDAGNPNIKKFSGALIIDDPTDVSKIKYENTRIETIGFYENKLATRRRTPTTPTILIMQRLHKEDLTGYLLENYPEDWDSLVIPAINKKGESFWPQNFPVKNMNIIRDKRPDLYFSQYQQNPTIEGGNLFKLDWFKFVNETPQKFIYRFITADTAYKDKQQNDYTVFGYWGVTYDNTNKPILYLIDMKRKRIKALDIERWIDSWIAEKISYGFRDTWIEDKGHGIYLNQCFRIKGYNIPSEDTIKETLPRERDKVERAHNIIAFIDRINYNVYINNHIECIEDLKSEIVGFPNATHDDIVDCLIDAVKIALAKKDMATELIELYGKKNIN